jgi:hypothetical protein
VRHPQRSVLQHIGPFPIQYVLGRLGDGRGCGKGGSLMNDMDEIRRLMEEFADEGQANASAEVAAVEVEKRAIQQMPDVWEGFSRLVLTETLQGMWRSLQRKRRVGEALGTGREKVSTWSRQAKAKLDERRSK